MALPLFNSFGVSRDDPAYCNCSTGVGNQDPCQHFNLLTSLVFVPPTEESLASSDPAVQLGLAPLVAVMARYPDYFAFNRAGYEAQYASQDNTFSAKNGSAKNERYSAFFDFCYERYTNSTCSLYTWHTFDPHSAVINALNYQLYNGQFAVFKHTSNLCIFCVNFVLRRARSSIGPARHP